MTIPETRAGRTAIVLTALEAQSCAICVSWTKKSSEIRSFILGGFAIGPLLSPKSALEITPPPRPPSVASNISRPASRC